MSITETEYQRLLSNQTAALNVGNGAKKRGRYQSDYSGMAKLVTIRELEAQLGSKPPKKKRKSAIERERLLGYNYEPFPQLHFRLPWVPSVNSAYANAKKGRIKTQAAREFANAVELDLLAQKVPCNRWASPLSVEVRQHASSDAGDPDNGLKVLLDCLKKFGVIADDNRAIIKRILVLDDYRVPAGHEFVEVTVSIVSQEQALEIVTKDSK